ncbi:UNVERIFIED_CONTAM: hypothetical protein RF653_17920 [Kocuria sp. CPCC 205316]|uniref:hypothetical protein n=1 Tax=Kocuria TaxID=57493 RepID=UPI0036DE1B4C
MTRIGTRQATRWKDLTPGHAGSAQGFLSDVDGWRVGQHVRELADVNGDGGDDDVGFGYSATYVGLS